MVAQMGPVRMVFVLLAIGFVACHGSMEMETAPYELGTLPSLLKPFWSIVWRLHNDLEKKMAIMTRDSAGESGGYGDEDQQEIDTSGMEDDSTLSNVDVNADDQVRSHMSCLPCLYMGLGSSQSAPLETLFLICTHLDLTGGSHWRG